jgi:hypothetical protein
VIGGAAGATLNLHDVPPTVTANAFTYEALPHNITFDFSMDVSASLALGDIEVLNGNTSALFVPDAVNYDTVNNRATFVFNSALPDGNYVARVAAGNVTHAMGEPLAADGVAAFFVFAGDANHDRAVDIGDFAALAASFNAAGSFSQGNFNYNALVDLGDFAILAARFNTTLPSDPRGSRPAASGATLTAQPARPPRSPFAVSRIDSVFDEIELSGSPDVI